VRLTAAMRAPEVVPVLARDHADCVPRNIGLAPNVCESCPWMASVDGRSNWQPGRLPLLRIVPAPAEYGRRFYACCSKGIGPPSRGSFAFWRIWYCHGRKQRPHSPVCSQSARTSCSSAPGTTMGHVAEKSNWPLQRTPAHRRPVPLTGRSVSRITFRNNHRTWRSSNVRACDP